MLGGRRRRSRVRSSSQADEAASLEPAPENEELELGEPCVIDVQDSLVRGETEGQIQQPIDGSQACRPKHVLSEVSRRKWCVQAQCLAVTDYDI